MTPHLSSYRLAANRTRHTQNPAHALQDMQKEFQSVLLQLSPRESVLLRVPRPDDASGAEPEPPAVTSATGWVSVSRGAIVRFADGVAMQVNEFHEENKPGGGGVLVGVLAATRAGLQKFVGARGTKLKVMPAYDTMVFMFDDDAEQREIILVKAEIIERRAEDVERVLSTRLNSDAPGRGEPDLKMVLTGKYDEHWRYEGSLEKKDLRNGAVTELTTRAMTVLRWWKEGCLRPRWCWQEE